MKFRVRNTEINISCEKKYQSIMSNVNDYYVLSLTAHLPFITYSKGIRYYALSIYWCIAI